MKTISSILFTTLFALSLSVSAITIAPSSTEIKYKVADANNNSGNPIGHGLYTFGKNGTGSASYSIQDGTYFTIDTSSLTATLIGSAVNSNGYTALIDLVFSSFVETNNYKTENGRTYNPTADDIANVLAAPSNGDIDFFETITGTVTINNVVFDIATCSNCGGTADPFGLQFGDGANAKNKSDFGGSAWVGVGSTPDMASHWDFNLTFIPVSEPSSLALIMLGLLGLARIRKAK